MLVVVKLLLSAGLIYLVNELVITRSRPLLGSMIAAIPLVTIITFIWIWFGLRDAPEEQAAKLASHSIGVFWFVLPSLPMFLIFPWLIKKGIPFWANLGLCCFITMGLFLLTTLILKRCGMEL
ncbi:MAG: hypothetical protein CMO47_09640 [Verrucomicrobiales bacterium]|nr:hypothetical protein [Verrucomicrobiales bacterium]|tara:strand:- start:972 stop:1340 length:369 start_codon:yes stop_codon:yes gene_type:complete